MNKNSNTGFDRNPILFLGCTLLAVASLLLEESNTARRPRLQDVRSFPLARNRVKSTHLKLVASNGKALGQTLRLVT
ncbi:MAG: hypothetical protein H7222_17450 [Methylotenera sp.]|nr:hypothetical protein [Oligoflexia bacterium]